MKLYYYYDDQADVFYLSQGKPSARDVSEEASNDVVLRKNPRTRQVKGFTILNFSRRLRRSGVPIALPIEAELTAS